MSLKIDNEWFIDNKGRKVLLRGVNLGGSSKVPTIPNGATHIPTDFSNHQNVSFINRPFPLDEAEEHFSRLKHWGFNCLRFLITWEAIEHEGPNQYDREYIKYLIEVLEIAKKFDFYIFIDPHQDVWSRMTGGDGAPGWIFKKLGLDITKLDESEAAFTMQKRYDPSVPSSYPPMCWSSNAVRFANGTMWTLFFGGNDFALSVKIDGKNAQDYLQEHYINSILQIVKELNHNSHIIGYDSLNEPEKGWIGKRVDGSGEETISDYRGHVFTPFEAMITAAGFSREIGFNEVKGVGIKETRRDILNKDNTSCWLNDEYDIWRNEGVWKIDEVGDPQIIDNSHFRNVNGKKIEFHRDYLSPFIRKFADKVREIDSDAIIFFEGHPGSTMSKSLPKFKLPNNVVHAGHWYDAATLVTKRPFLRANYDITRDKLVIGKQNVQKMFTHQLKLIKEFAKGEYPTLIGEFGLHYDIKNKKAYKKVRKKPIKAWKTHVKALDMYYNALDANLIHATQWNYTADNNNRWGDKWNLEDLSIFSRDQQFNPDDINSGGRAIRGFCRPHLLRCAGEPLKMTFNKKKGEFHFQFQAIPLIKAPSLFYIPKIQYPDGYSIHSNIEDIRHEIDGQTLKVWVEGDAIIELLIRKK
ncbi:MAG: hypothetical protein BAJALOKI3v1_20068 [Promethearchaeota archaeon]|nr:MAG: hypothetical protein BAJALOKI3v1_20068 [Candidatus Lokiarchaeota archaeon]